MGFRGQPSSNSNSTSNIDSHRAIGIVIVQVIVIEVAIVPVFSCKGPGFSVLRLGFKSSGSGLGVSS